MTQLPLVLIICETRDISTRKQILNIFKLSPLAHRAVMAASSNSSKETATLHSVSTSFEPQQTDGRSPKGMMVPVVVTQPTPATSATGGADTPSRTKVDNPLVDDEAQPQAQPKVVNVMPKPPDSEEGGLKTLSSATEDATTAPKRGDPLELIIGTKPECQYIKKKLLGQGSFGSAWRVEEKSTGNTYAAKIMDTSSMSAKDRGFVTNEVRCLAKCSHPNIVRHDSNTEVGGMLMIIMEFADGGDLYKQIKARQPSMKYFREHEIQFIFLQLCLALDHIHTKKMMHRDLKSANVLLTTTGLVKLGDFGFSRQYEDTLSNPVGSTFCGTPYYLSPEIWRRAPYSKKTEMWALGVILYEVTALKRPFSGKNMDDLIDNILHCRRQPLPAIYSAELCAVVSQLLNVDPAQRPSIRVLFHQPFIRKSLEMLKKSVENHARISSDIRQEICSNVDDILNSDIVDYESSRVVPKIGCLKRHTADRGWQDCELNLATLTITIKDLANTALPDEVIDLSTLTSVCPIDPSIANEQFVFAMKNQTGKAYWFKELSTQGFQEWLGVLQNAMPY